MKRRLELESQKIKYSLSQGKSLTTKHSSLNASRMHLERSSKPFLNLTKCNNLISSNDIADSFDTCIFPSSDFSSAVSPNKKKSTGCQTERTHFSLESLNCENVLLTDEVKFLRKELDELKEIVGEMQMSKQLARMKTNEDMINHLHRENLLLKNTIEKNLSFKNEEDTQAPSEYS